MSKILHMLKAACANAFACAIALLGKPLQKLSQIKSRNIEKNCAMEQR